MGGSRWAKLGKHYRPASERKELEKKGKNPEEIRKELGAKADLARKLKRESEREHKPIPVNEAEEKKRLERIEREHESARKTLEEAQEKDKKEREERENPPKSLLDEVRNQAAENIQRRKDDEEKKKEEDRKKRDEHIRFLIRKERFDAVSKHVTQPRPVDKGFFGHYLPTHFKRTSIISTHGRVR